ncbi:MAG: hypothetical protein E7647_02530 [Ruminococcaceae bacterium]|nr:hypothetical protein [Oscillospiraceae bacterium]
MAAPKVKVRVMYSTKKAKVKTFAEAISQAFKCLANQVPGDFPCDKERVVFIGMTIKDAPEDKLRLFCRELTPARAQNVALFVDGPKGDDNKGLKVIIDTLKEAGTNVLTDDIYYVNGGPAIFGGKKISLEERTEIVRWAEGIVAKLS